MTTATIDDRATAESERRARVRESSLRRFRPGLALGFQQDLRHVLHQLSIVPADEVEQVLSDAVATARARHDALQQVGLTPTDLLPTARYGVTLRILRDLVMQGWELRFDDEGVILQAPGRASKAVTDPEREKEALRRSFSFTRMAQLHEPSTVRFIAEMERKGVRRHFADGRELANRVMHSSEGIRPELELIQPGTRDPLTGLLLQDVWRYARHYWSIPYQSTPGRNVFYLVRDAAVPARPLIGIAALGNPILGLARRDDYYGWSVKALRSRLGEFSADDEQQLAAHLYAVVLNGMDEIYVEDLWPEKCPDNWRSVVATLEEIEGHSAAERLAQLDNADVEDGRGQTFIRQALATAEDGNGENVDWKAIAKTPLYRRKRAGTLADLMRAWGTLRDLGFSQSGGDFRRAIACEEGVRAIDIALRRVKQQVIAANVMELITCGALPPYRDVLGGKLVAMLMLSSDVVRDVEHRYSGRVSLIASALAARPICRPARLALITTSSLYEIASSQYNRIKIPVPGGALTYKKIGATESFGTVHFASDTVADLSLIARLTNNNKRQINNLFGEGTSPKLRLVRSGLDALGLQSDTFLRHQAPRLLYAAALCSNIERLALGLDDEPRYLLPPDTPSVEFISAHWRARWLSIRANRPDILERLRGQAPEGFQLSRELKPSDAAVALRGVVVGVHRQSAKQTQEEHNQQTFIERLYRSSKSYADRLSEAELDAIHVDLGTDSYLVEQAEAGRQIIVTGNPGDGKTHLIERMRPQLEAAGARVITDANACSDEDVLDAWEACRGGKRPFVLAINEWPLFVLGRSADTRGVLSVAEALRQVTSARFFVQAQTPEDPKENVTVIDLSLRNLLAPSVVQRVVDRLTQDQFYVGLNPADPMVRNRAALREAQVQERLVAVLELVAGRVTHVTMRQLVGFIAFLLTGGQSAAGRMKAGQDSASFSYSNLAFDSDNGGIGPLFAAVRDVFDPAAITHPDWDSLLWLGETDPRDWRDLPPPSILALPEAEREAAYRAIKRRFFFEHVHGRELLEMVPADELEFTRCLQGEHARQSSLVRDLVLALNRFFEPDCPDEERDRLQLWQSHRYDVRAPSAFVAMHALPHHQLRIEPSRVASWVEAWLPADQQNPRSFGLVASAADGLDVALLEVNRDLFLTLVEAQRGLGRASWSRTTARRITRFIDRVHRAVEGTPGVQDLRIRNVESDLDERFSIQRTPARYQL